MSKLLALKEWITLDEASRYLTGVFSEEVSIADLYRFSLGNKLTLSANFVNHGRANLGRKLLIRNAGFRILAALTQDERQIFMSVTGSAMPEFEAWLESNEDQKKLLSAEEPKAKYIMLKGLQISATECIQLEEDVASIEGIWDLSMIGAERIDIEYALQQQVNGPEVDLVNLEGVLLVKSDGQYARLLERFSDNSASDSKLEPKKWDDSRAYYPAGKIPDDAPIVVRPQAIMDFVALVSNTPQHEKPIDERERSSMLRLIKALGVMASLPPRGAATAIQHQLETLGFSSPKEKTIKDYLDAAKALEPEKP